jgi:hypothetical protein
MSHHTNRQVLQPGQCRERCEVIWYSAAVEVQSCQ